MKRTGRHVVQLSSTLQHISPIVDHDKSIFGFGIGSLLDREDLLRSGIIKQKDKVDYG